jgi:hypothetical protein
MSRLSAALVSIALIAFIGASLTLHWDTPSTPWSLIAAATLAFVLLFKL